MGLKPVCTPRNVSERSSIWRCGSIGSPLRSWPNASMSPPRPSAVISTCSTAAESCAGCTVAPFPRRTSGSSRPRSPIANQPSRCRRDASPRPPCSSCRGGAGSTVLLDSGTTTGRFAAALGDAQVPTIVTNSVHIASQLALLQGGPVHLLGGRVRWPHPGDRRWRDRGIPGSAAPRRRLSRHERPDPQHGLSTPDPDEAAVKRAMVRSARRKVVLADSSKVGATLLISFAGLNEVDVLVTDSGLSESDRQQLVNAGLEVVVA